MTEPIVGEKARTFQLQQNRTVVHPRLQVDPSKQLDEIHTFVVCADTQFGMTRMNKDWEAEKDYSRKAVQAINELQPRPLFCCVCGDLVDMTSLIYQGKENPVADDAMGGPPSRLSEEECNQIQDAQNQDFKRIWSDVHPDIALVCLCGNHDVGNRPTKASVERFVAAFGDDCLAWWANGTYNIALNTSLFADPTGAQDLFDAQLSWLEGRLAYAKESMASNIFVFGHHPWFLYRENETSEELQGESPFPAEWGGFRADLGRGSEKDGYFHIPLRYRRQALELFEKYGVSAAFSGHFHQNLVAKTSFGMDMIITGPLSLVFQSTGVPEDFPEPRTQGIRVVRVDRATGRYEHEFISI
jgi:hypothetical protein